MRTSRSSLQWIAIASGATALVAAVPGTAHAEPVVGADMHGTVVVGDARGPINGGFGFDGRFGYRFSAVLVALTPEVGAGYIHLVGDVPDAERGITRVFAGARLGLGVIVQPAIFAHAGYGWVSLTNVDGSDRAPMFDGGLAVDLRLIPHITPGVHAAYNTVTTSPVAHQWVDLGAHLEIAF